MNEPGKYSVIYADPPWHYRVWSKKGTGPVCGKPLFHLVPGRYKGAAGSSAGSKGLCPVSLGDVSSAERGVAGDGCLGFSYKSVAFVWVKQNRKAPTLFTGMGYWTRANAEICLLATRGHPKRANAGVHQVILSHIEEHSKKPEEARSRIVRLMGDVPRIELFARSRAPGWDVWGNEAAGSIQGWPPC